MDGEEAAETLFVFGCYLGEVLVRQLGGAWVPTARSSLRAVSPWPMVVQLPDGSSWDVIGKAYKRLELGDSEFLPGVLRRCSRGPPAAVTDGEEPDPRALVAVPITGELDLHAFAPREVPSLVAEYLRACRERGILEVRLVHGRGRGVQRAVVRRLLRSASGRRLVSRRATAGRRLGRDDRRAGRTSVRRRERSLNRRWSPRTRGRG